MPFEKSQTDVVFESVVTMRVQISRVVVIVSDPVQLGLLQ